MRSQPRELEGIHTSGLYINHTPNRKSIKKLGKMDNPDYVHERRRTNYMMILMFAIWAVILLAFVLGKIHNLFAPAKDDIAEEKLNLLLNLLPMAHGYSTRNGTH